MNKLDKVLTVSDLNKVLSANTLPQKYKCEKCGYESTKTFLYVFENQETHFCIKCLNDFYLENLPRAIPLNEDK